MKILGYHIHILISKNPVDMKKVKGVIDGKLHFRKNPTKRRKEKKDEQKQGTV